MAAENPDETTKAEKISAWIDGELTTEALGHDPKFRQEAQETKAAWDLLDHLPKPEKNPALTNRTMALLQLRDTQPTTIEANITPSKVAKSAFLPMVGWWAALTIIFAISFRISDSLIASNGKSHAAVARYLWLNAASVPVEYRHDIEFLKWLVGPERFGIPKP